MARAESTQDRGAARLAAGPEIISGPAAAGASPKQRRRDVSGSSWPCCSVRP